MVQDGLDGRLGRIDQVEHLLLALRYQPGGQQLGLDPGYEPGPKTFSIGMLRKTLESNQIPEGTSRLAGGPYLHQGLSSLVFTTGYDPITSDVSDRRSTN